MTRFLACLLAVFPIAAAAGGSNYGIVPGVHPDLAGKVTEWPVPTPRFARDPAPGPDGNIYITVMSGNKIARFDTKTHAFKEWAMPADHHLHGLLVDKQGMVWTTGNGKLAKVDPAASEVVKEYQLPAGNGGPYAVAVDGGGMVWVNEINTDSVVRFNPANDEMRIVQLPSKNTGIRKMIVDAGGKLWYMGSHNGRLGVVE